MTRQTLADWDASDLADSASLIVSELVTNAVVHTGTPVELGLRLHGGELRLEVEDRHPGRVLPLVDREPSEVEEHGRGLMIASSLATAWGVEYQATSKRVWAIVERPGARADDRRPAPYVGAGVHVAVVEVSGDGDGTGWTSEATAVRGWAEEEVVGRPFVELVDASLAERLPHALSGETVARRWQGRYAVVRKVVSETPVFGSHVPADDD
jgi:anti-sigma regulatory factor (Ser/Thr protein kinase)